MQLTERRKGNEHYRAGRFAHALHHYDRARSIVEYAKGTSAGDQQELDANRVAVYLNIAAVCIATQEHSVAVHWCSQALVLEPHNVKGLLRRAKANLRRHEYEVGFSATMYCSRVQIPTWDWLLFLPVCIAPLCW